jgi:hypothetical protein
LTDDDNETLAGLLRPGNAAADTAARTWLDRDPARAHAIHENGMQSLMIGLGLVPFDAVELELPEGSLLAFYTDGLVETRNDDIDVAMHRLGANLAAHAGRPLPTC